MIKAAVTINSHMLHTSEPEDIEDYVHRELRTQIANEIMKTVDIDITTTKNALDDTITYSASLPITHSTASSVIVGSSVGYNGTFTNNHVSGIITKQPELRVMEYTKNGKVTRVELQYYDGDDWIKVPRHQLEE
jgi:hypothetical protein